MAKNTTPQYSTYFTLEIHHFKRFRVLKYRTLPPQYRILKSGIFSFIKILKGRLAQKAIRRRRLNSEEWVSLCV
jgi:hypothetical protein